MISKMMNNHFKNIKMEQKHDNAIHASAIRFDDLNTLQLNLKYKKYDNTFALHSTDAVVGVVHQTLNAYG